MQWAWAWANFGSWWGSGRPDLLQSMGSQRAGHDWAAEQLLSLLVGMVLTVSAALSRLGILSGYGRMAVLENNEEDERMICDERRVWKSYRVLSLGWARILLITHQYLFKHLILLLLFVGIMCCLLIHLWWPHRGTHSSVTAFEVSAFPQGAKRHVRCFRTPHYVHIKSLVSWRPFVTLILTLPCPASCLPACFSLWVLALLFGHLLL